MSKTTENIIVVIIMLAIVVGLLCFIGYDNIKDWLSTPFIWKENDDITIQPFNKQETSDEDITIQFLIENRTGQTIKEYEFWVYIEDVEIKIASKYLYDTVDPYDVKIEEATITKDTFPAFSEIEVDESTYEKFLNMKLESLQTLVKTVYLRNEDDVLVHNNGTGKIIAILAVSLILGLLGIVNKFPVWLRITLKVCSLPITLFLVILCVFWLFASGKNNSSGSQSSNDIQHREAKQRYDRAANLKAGAIKTGNVHSAAKAQEQMDRAMADMITANGSGSSSAREAADRYKRESNLKAGATITGRTGDAARAQANMDKALSDMIKRK